MERENLEDLKQGQRLLLMDHSKELPSLRKSVFSRFCSCGGNITVGLVTDEGYVAAEERWNEQHSGPEHYPVTRHEWLTVKLNHAA